MAGSRQPRAHLILLVLVLAQQLINPQHSLLYALHADPCRMRCTAMIASRSCACASAVKGCRAPRPKAADARDAPPRLAVFDAIFFHRAVTMLAPHMLEAFEFLCAGCRTARATDARDAPPCLAVFDAFFFHRASTRLAPRSMMTHSLSG